MSNVIEYIFIKENNNPFYSTKSNKDIDYIAK